MAHLKDSILINAATEKVHSLASDPHKWSSWFVGLGEAEKVTGDGSAGTEVKHSYLMAGIHVPVTTNVTDHRAEADGSYYWKAKIEGMFDGWHTWVYRPQEGKTLVEVEMEYQVPGSVLGKVADRLFLERNQERAMRHTLENLKELCEA
jgi:uncharacterized membrane protein